MQIILSPKLTKEHQEILLVWLQNPRALNRKEWTKALSAFDLLRLCTVLWQGHEYTFTAFYEHVIDEKYATPFIQEIYSLDKIEQEGYHLLLAYTQRILDELIQLGLSLTGNREERLLLAHCLYWWNSFGKGYLYEVTIFKDLQATGIRFIGHNLYRREERLSSFDLVVLGHRGDIKTSTYFLHVTRTFPLRHDFYITRLFEVDKRKWHDVVILKPSFWKEINGEPHHGSLEEILKLFPQAVLIEVHDVSLIVVSYDYWKQKVKAQQQQEDKGT